MKTQLKIPVLYKPIYCRPACISLSHCSFTITATFNGYKKNSWLQTGPHDNFEGSWVDVFFLGGGPKPCRPDFEVCS